MASARSDLCTRAMALALSSSTPPIPISHSPAALPSVSPRTLALPSRPTPPGLLSARRRRSCYAAASSSPSMADVSAAPGDGGARALQDWLLYARAYWVSKYLIAWNTTEEDADIFLYSSRNAGLHLSNGVIEGYDLKVQLEPDMHGLPSDVKEKFPHIRNYRAYRVPSSVDVANTVKCQIAVASYRASGTIRNSTCLQLPGVLDDMFAYTGPLGSVFSEQAVALYLWAPTAQDVSVHFYKDPQGSQIEQIQLKEFNGVWSVNLSSDYECLYYVYEVLVYHPSTMHIERCVAADPYSRGLSSNGRMTWLVNIDSKELKPAGWDELADTKPKLHCISDISIYELHIRDFSVFDYKLNPDVRGGYLAFTSKDSAGMAHLKKLADAGLSHVHLLPVFHFGSVDDNKKNWRCLDEVELSKFPPDSEKQQAAVAAIKNEDGYNWGYDPVLWGTPKGSYATNPECANRILECRQMIQALNHIGLRVILDVVYNHLYASGPSDQNSVLDKIVPGYYLRRNTDGAVENSAAMNNTASEHFMVERLILDDLLCWAVAYKVDGFRFDLMGHIMKHTMVKAKSILQNLSRDKNGIDGSKIYIYGEGWDFGEVEGNKRGINASQLNMAGTGIGSFNDRLRDAVRGGSPFGNPLQQGFATGLSLEPNYYYQGNECATRQALSWLADHIKVGLAGNLSDFILTCHSGESVKGSEILTHDGKPVGYALSPIETVNYVSAHDNETLFDIINLKTPASLSIEEKCRMNHLATSIIGLSQGTPFFHCGDEILRSKSLDRDSYNSGDWFNKVDFTYESNNWGVGLPPREKNESTWPLIKPLLANPLLKPGQSLILAAVDNFVDILKIRYSSPLFRLRTANDILERVRFHNSGPSWVPGVIVMTIEDGHGDKPGMLQLDPLYSYIAVVFNARPHDISLEIPALMPRSLQLHPVQLASTDPLVKDSAYSAATGTFMVPRRTTAVFLEARR